MVVRSGFSEHNSDDEVNKAILYTDRLIMASSSSLEVFNAKIENIDNYKECFISTAQPTRSLKDVRKL